MSYNDIAIRVENLSKKFTLQHAAKDEHGNNTHALWALKDVSFEIKKGESVGIIGPNGSGKSTLLKILAGVTKPTTGKVEIFGRVASILDIGAGFHPELSGRENVFLNGQLLGFSKKEIQGKFDEIVDFSGIEKFIYEPVKNYSNGMYLRLAFSIMAHLDFDVYLFDEVFSVGDAEFKNKIENIYNRFPCILLVSHDYFEIDKICKKIIYIEKGQTKLYYTKHNKIINYTNNNNTGISEGNIIRINDINLAINKIKVEDEKINISRNEDITVTLSIMADNKIIISGYIENMYKKKIIGFAFESVDSTKEVVWVIPKKLLYNGVYSLSLVTSTNESKEVLHEIAFFEITSEIKTDTHGVSIFIESEL
jgi:lipopolysaccharide transport system ATP-binding protein